MASRNVYLFPISSIPQDPFLPVDGPYGPSFLDTQACVCALRNLPLQDKSAWQCLGNKTEDVYVTTSGKWFEASGSGPLQLNASVADASSPPNTSQAFVYNHEQAQLVPIKRENENDGVLDIYSDACTGTNQSTFSATFYRTAADLAEGRPPTEAMPCYRPGAVPMEIENATSWLRRGCNLGFLCANNTVNSLPQFCPPITQCQEARLTGMVCSYLGSNIGMGLFEPVVCLQGYFCPPGGREIKICPRGSYCQPGTAFPTPCSRGSSCPEGSQFELFIIPVVLLILFDIGLVVVTIWHTLLNRLSKRLARRDLRSKERNARVGMRSAAMGGVDRQGHVRLASETEAAVAMEMAPDSAARHVTEPESPSLGFGAAASHISRTRTRTSSSMQDGCEEDEAAPQIRSFINSMRKATDAAAFGLTFTYTNLSFQPKRAPRPILQNVTGSIDQGSLVAVMGGSGAGKSTFVNVLMGKITNTKGLVTINNVPGRINRYKKVIGYVPQDDIVLPELTVYENILHSAQVRLPQTWSEDDITAHVDAVIDCLELSHVRNSPVGWVGRPVISGGQRKRVSIGMELAAAPMAIFLDEPTSGLDATAASSIMNTLQVLAGLGMTIIVVIHQPRMEIFDMFDSLILLANGQIIYEGPERGVKGFFEGMGYTFPEHGNFGDIVTDIITGNGRAYKKSGDTSKEGLIAHWYNTRENAVDGPSQSGQVSQLSFVTNLLPKMDPRVHQMLKTRGASRIRQVRLCLRRSFVQQYRTKSIFWFEMGLASLAGFLIGLAQHGKKGVMFVGFYKEPFNVLSIATDMASVPQLALLTAIGIGLVSAAPSVRVFSEEMLLHQREAEAGHSRLAYFLAKLIAVLPRMILGCLHFTSFMMVLATPVMPWEIAFLANLVYVYCIYGMANCVSMITKRQDAPLFSTMICLIIGILSGASPPLAQVKTWHLEWLWRASPGTWLVELYFGQLVSPFDYLYEVRLASEFTGFQLHRLWKNILVLLLIGTIYRVLAFLGLFLGQRLRL